MHKVNYPYNESLLQWIWQNLEFETQGLKTECGKKIRIISQGEKNNGSGPDFSGCKIRIDEVDCFGDTELHIHPEGWALHNHRDSKLFNRVILHVVYDYGASTPGSRAIRPDGTEPPLLVLKPYLEKSLQALFEKRSLSSLRCAGNIQFINQSAFEEQVEKAHLAYFEYKVNFLLSRYPAELSVNRAWLNLFSAGMFNTLGIPVNRNQMEDLHELIYPQITGSESRKEFIDTVSGLAFSPETPLKIEWKHTGMRPASLPEKRVHQAASLCYSLHNMRFRKFLSPDLSAWKELLASVPPSDLPGRQMLRILRHTVYLPATWLLGDLLFSRPLKTGAYNAWRAIQGGIPQEVAGPFVKAGFELNKHTRKPGLAHQLKRYCRPGNCHRCEVFKKAISS